MHALDRVDKLVRGGVFENITHSAGFDRRRYLGVLAKAGQDHSDFRQQLAAAEKQWRSWNESILGGEPFDVGSASGAGDGSWILRDVLDELDATVSGR